MQPGGVAGYQRCWAGVISNWQSRAWLLSLLDSTPLAADTGQVWFKKCGDYNGRQTVGADELHR